MHWPPPEPASQGALTVVPQLSARKESSGSPLQLQRVPRSVHKGKGAEDALPRPRALSSTQVCGADGGRGRTGGCPRPLSSSPGSHRQAPLPGDRMSLRPPPERPSQGHGRPPPWPPCQAGTRAAESGGRGGWPAARAPDGASRRPAERREKRVVGPAGGQQSGGRGGWPAAGDPGGASRRPAGISMQLPSLEHAAGQWLPLRLTCIFWGWGSLKSFFFNSSHVQLTLLTYRMRWFLGRLHYTW